MAERDVVRAGPDAATLAAFCALVVLAGGNAVGIRYVSCDGCELDPFWGAAMRFLLAGAIFAVVAAAVRAGLPRGRALLGAVLYGALQFGARVRADLPRVRARPRRNRAGPARERSAAHVRARPRPAPASVLVLAGVYLGALRHPRPARGR